MTPIFSQNATVLPEKEFPMIYTTTGPLPIGNGLAATANTLVFDPNLVTQGDLDCGIFGSQA
jgi:hypothetical protein